MSAQAAPAPSAVIPFPMGSVVSAPLEPICFQMEREARFTPAIKAQTLGEGLRAHQLEKLNRYETHLDRKFANTCHAFEVEAASRRLKCNIAKSGAEPVRLWLSARISEKHAANLSNDLGKSRR